MVFNISIRITTLLLLACVALVVGFVDSIAGGGGMITIPALYMAGIPRTRHQGQTNFKRFLGALARRCISTKRGIYTWLNAHFLCFLPLCFRCVGHCSCRQSTQIFCARQSLFCLSFSRCIFSFSPKISQSGKDERASSLDSRIARRLPLAFAIGGILSISNM